MGEKIKVKVAQDFFCRAMAAGWAGDGAETAVTTDLTETVSGQGLWNETEFTYEDEKKELFLRDKWMVNKKTGFNTGHTIIYHQGRPVWIMYYGGYYTKRATPVVKAALAHCYELGKFHGGRGEMRFVQSNNPSLVYRNGVAQNDFTEFWGVDSVFDQKQGNQLGGHRYMGHALVKME